VLGTACDIGSPPESVTLGFSEFAGQPRDEAPLAAEIARHYGSRHSVRWVDRAEFDRDLPAILAAMDQPSIDGINTWFVSKAARELGWKVALSGLGGDELFGGYPSFRDVPTWVRWLHWAARMPRLAERCGRIIGRISRHPKAQGLLRFGGSWSGAYYLRRGLFMPWEVEAEKPTWLPTDPEAVDESLAELEQLIHPNPGTDHARVSVLETGAYMRNQLLRDSDWASMAHSIELRVPLVDSRLAAGIAPSLPALVPGAAKAALAAVPAKPLPRWLVDRPKTGFETPVSQWMDASVRGPGEPWARGWARSVLSRWAGAGAH
jgi:asparagine synthase (glutamine-hydrolysing)